MADPLKMDGIRGLTDPNLCTVEASCVTGFEQVAMEEIQEKFPGQATTCNRGRVICDIPLDRVKEVLSLRTVDNAWVMLGHNHHHDYPDNTEGQLDSLSQFCLGLDWTKGLNVWRTVMNFNGELYPPASGEVVTNPPNDCENGGEAKPAKIARIVPTFRLTCYRTGSGHHLFTSMEAAKTVGGAVQDKFQWGVKMKNYDIEVCLNTDQDQVYVGLALNNTSLYKNRTITAFGPTTLRPTICSGLVRLARVKAGEVVLDPMCGGGSIPIEGEAGHPGYFLGGEIHEMAIGRCNDNNKSLTSATNRSHRIDFVQWNVMNACLRDSSVDVVITDLPFGKRSGSKADNRTLYPATLLSLARLTQPKTGRAVLLTQDRNSMFKSIPKVAKYWKTVKHIQCNIGGLTALVFVLSRTDSAFSS